MIYSIKHEEMTQEHVANLWPYAHKAYGDSMLKSLSVETKAIIHEWTWDKKIGRPVTKLDRELEDILQKGDDLDYADISLITKEVIRPSDVVVSNNFTPELDFYLLDSEE